MYLIFRVLTPSAEGSGPVPVTWCRLNTVLSSDRMKQISHRKPSRVVWVSCEMQGWKAKEKLVPEGGEWKANGL